MDIQVLITMIIFYIISMWVIEPVISIILDDECIKYEMIHTVTIVHTLLLCGVLWAYGMFTISKFLCILITETVLRLIVIDPISSKPIINRCVYLIPLTFRILVIVATIYY